MFVLELEFSFQVEGSVVHIMKALARHPGAAHTLAECDRFQYMFHMVVMGGTTPLLSPTTKREARSAPPVHLAQLYRHVLQVLSRFVHLLIISTHLCVLNGHKIYFVPIFGEFVKVSYGNINLCR